MGHGDIKMARGIGAVLLPATACLSFALAVVLGAVLGIVQVLALRGRAPEAASATGTGAAPDSERSDPDDPGDLPPETIGSLLRCGLGYVLCIDCIGLFVPKLYKSWFGEEAFLPFEEVEDFEVERTMIPFGPYLALGAIVATVFQSQLLGAISSYWKWATGGP